MILFANNAVTTLGSALSNTATTAQLFAGSGALFPSPGPGQYFVATLTDAATGLLTEIVHVTARSTDTVTIVRAQEGTDALNWKIGDLFDNFMTAGQAAAMGQVMVYPGNPNGNVAGAVGVPGQSSSDLLWDSVDDLFFVCTASGSAATAVWTYVGASVVEFTGQFWCGTSTGLPNAQVVTPPSFLTTFPPGTPIAFIAGFTNTGAATLTVGSFGTVSLYKDGISGPTALTGEEIVAGNVVAGRFAGGVIHITPAPGTATEANTGRTVVAAGMGAQTLETANPVQTISSNTVGALTDNGKTFVATSSLTYSLPLSTSLWNGWPVSFTAKSGPVLLTPNAADSINGGTPGASYSVTLGTSVKIVTDGAGHWWTEYQTLPLSGVTVLLNTLVANGTQTSLTDVSSLGAGYTYYEIVISGLTVATGSSPSLSLQVSEDNGATWKSSNYIYQMTSLSGVGPPAYNGASDAVVIPLMTNPFEATGSSVSGTVTISNPSSSTQTKPFIIHTNSQFGLLDNVGSGVYAGDNGAINGLKFVFDNQIMTSGAIYIYAR